MATFIRCPECGAVAELVRGGAICEPLMVADRQRHRAGAQASRTRPATFYACTACEWCAEAGDVAEGR